MPAKNDPDCLFCKIVKGEIPAHILFQDEEITIFKDITPQAPTHVLAIPNQHLESIYAAGKEEEALLGRILLLINAMAQELGIAEDGFRIVLNKGEKAGQTVFHLHFHLLGGREFNWPPG